MNIRSVEFAKRLYSHLGLDAVHYGEHILPAAHLLVRNGVPRRCAVPRIGARGSRSADRTPGVQRVYSSARRWLWLRQIGYRHSGCVANPTDMRGGRQQSGSRVVKPDLTRAPDIPIRPSRCEKQTLQFRRQAAREQFGLPFDNASFDVANALIRLLTYGARRHRPISFRAAAGPVCRRARVRHAVRGKRSAGYVNPADNDRQWQGPLHCVRYRRALIESRMLDAGLCWSRRRSALKRTDRVAITSGDPLVDSVRAATVRPATPSTSTPAGFMTPLAMVLFRRFVGGRQPDISADCCARTRPGIVPEFAAALAMATMLAYAAGLSLPLRRACPHAIWRGANQRRFAAWSQW